MGLGLETSTGPNTVQISVDVEFQQVCGVIAGPPCRLGTNSCEPSFVEIQSVSEGVNKPDRVLRMHIVVDTSGQPLALIAFAAFDVGHAVDY